MVDSDAFDKNWRQSVIVDSIEVGRPKPALIQLMEIHVKRQSVTRMYAKNSNSKHRSMDSFKSPKFLAFQPLTNLGTNALQEH